MRTSPSIDPRRFSVRPILAPASRQRIARAVWLLPMLGAFALVAWKVLAP